MFQYISDELQRTTAGSRYHLLTTKANFVLSNRPDELEALSPCQQEEADTRMMLHLRHAAEQGHTKAYLRTVDSDVVVLAINLFQELVLSELWTGFGSGKAYRDIPIYHISKMLGPQKWPEVPGFNPPDPACLIPAWEACPAHCSVFLEAIPLQNSRDSRPQ
ncbi:hypothetical protein JOB18_027320 [Solea senegalensis]|uniref:Hexosyltransferase n=1 Tax=Solea senegalensis TaxID=28829 RepID=A0AAV6QBT1_SOLSE|nr:hypothetical protein JOB18_027320 [Solea senegalensis]